MSNTLLDTIAQQAYVPPQAWPTIEDLAVGYDEYTPSRSPALQGRTWRFAFDNPSKWEMDHSFDEKGGMTWRITRSNEPSEVGLTGKVDCQVFEFRKDIFYVTFFKPEYDEEVTLSLDLHTGQVLIFLSGFYERDGVRRTRTQVDQARVIGFDNVVPYETSAALVGKRVLYRYSPRDWYEHVYFNRGTFSWHCVKGIERGLADTEQCVHYELAPGLFVLHWTETNLPVESVVMIDFEASRSVGRFFCWDPKVGRRVQMLFGSYPQLLNETQYPDAA